MEKEERIKKTAKELIKKTSVLCQLDGSYAMIDASSQKEKQNAVEKKMKTSMGYGFSGKITNLVQSSIKKQLNELSNEDIQQLSNFIVNENREGLDLKKYATLNNLIGILTQSIIDRAVENNNYLEMFEGLDDAVLLEIKEYAERNQPEEMKETVSFVQELGSQEVEDVKRIIYSGQLEYRKVLEEVNKVIAIKNEINVQ